MKIKQIIQLTVIRESGDSQKFILKNGSITAGQEKSNDIAINCSLKRFNFLQKKSNGYKLFIPKDMRGILYAQEKEPVSLNSLRELRLLSQKKNGHILPLYEGTRAELFFKDIQLKLEYIDEPPADTTSLKKKHGDIVDEDSRDFWLMFIISSFIHGFIFFYCQTIPPLPVQRETTLAAAPDRFVNLVLKTKTVNPFEEKNLEDIKDKVQKALDIKKDKPKEMKEAALPNEEQVKEPEPAASAKNKEPRGRKNPKNVSSPKKTNSDQKQPNDRSAPKKDMASTGKPKSSLKASLVADVDLKDLPGSKGKNENSSTEVQMASLNPKLEEKGLQEGQKKKIDLNSIGILGMISERESSKSSSSAISSQLDLLAENTISGRGETILKQIEKIAPSVENLLENGEELNDELALEEGSELNNQEVKSGTKKTSKLEPVKADLSKKIDNLVAQNQKTDSVQLPSQDDAALKKLVEVKSSGPKSELRTPEVILRVASSYKASITHCYNKALKHSPNLKGRLVIEFAIEASGKISKVEIISLNLDNNNSGLEECVISMVKNWRFPEIPQGVTTVIYPFVFFPTL